MTVPLPKILLTAVLLCSGLITGCGRNAPSANAGGPPPVPVQLLEIQPSIVENRSEFTGSLQAAQRVELKSETQGRVEELFVKLGDRVKKGMVVIILKSDQTSPRLQKAQEQVTDARVTRESAVQQLKVAESQRETAKSNYELAKTNYDRAKLLVSQGAIGQITADQAKNQLDAAVSALKSAGDQVKVARTAIAQAETGIRQAEAQLASISANLQSKQVLSPMAGTVSDLPIKIGDSVSTGQSVATITQDKILDLRISVPQGRSVQLRKGISVELIDPASQKRIGTGSIHSISPRVNPNAQEILATARFPNPNGKLRDGQYVQVRLLWNKSSGILVPSTAITRTGSQSFVFVVQESPCSPAEPNKPSLLKGQMVVCQRIVELGDIQDTRYSIKSGLKPGERIAVSNLLKLRDDVPITPTLPSGS